MIYFDHLRPPPPFDPSALAYKDWLHLNVLDHATGQIGIVNLSLHGAPGDPRSRAVGTALVHVPGGGWHGNLEVHSLDAANLGPASIGLERTALAVRYPSGRLLASVQDSENSLSMRLSATPAAAPIIVEERLPLGQGPGDWISWYAAPRLKVTGEWVIGEARSDLGAASAYHDHNWGRWHWGDDFGWEWGCFLTPAPGAAFVFSRTTDRAHRKLGQPSLTVRADDKRRTFAGPAIEVSYSGELGTVSRRLPGALAALHQDLIHVRLPKHLRLAADDGFDQVSLAFTGQDAVQLIAGDPIARGYSFIHEIAGEFAYNGKLGGVEIAGKGLGVLEHVC
jgi:hypothetical protein